MNPLIWLFFAHLVADGFLQSRKIATTKSTSLVSLTKHIGDINFCMLIASLYIFQNLHQAIAFTLANGLFHALIDWNIWRGYKTYVLWKSFDKKIPWKDRPGLISPRYKYYEDHAFYATILLDQFLHAVCLIVFYDWVMRVYK